jgi:putative membrane protein
MKKIFLCCILAASMLSCEDDIDNSGGAPVLNSQDRAYAMQASMNSFTTVQMSNLAVSKTTDPTIRSFAERLVAEHTEALKKINFLSNLYGMTAVNSMDASHTMIMNELNNLSGRGFDMLYINTQVQDHRNALGALDAQINGGLNSKFKDNAKAMRPAVSMHLDEAEHLAAPHIR